MGLTNQGQDFSTILDDVPVTIQMEMAAVARKEIANHPAGDTCSCPIIEALAKLYSHGYKVVKAQEGPIHPEAEVQRRWEEGSDEHKADPLEFITLSPENYDEIIERTKHHREPITKEILERNYAKAKANGKQAYVFIMPLDFWEKEGSYGASTASGDSPTGAP